VRGTGARRRVLSLVAGVSGLIFGGRAGAFDFADGRIHVHGFYETQIRGIARDFDASDDWDLTQLAHVLNLEVEANLLDGVLGPFDLIDVFVRVEVRYDCVWTRACGLFESANTFGDGAKKLPKRLDDGRRDGFVGNVFVGDTRYFRGEPIETMDYPFRFRPRDSRRPYGIDRTPAFFTLFTSPGPDGVLGTADDPAPFYFDRYLRPHRCKFSSRGVRGIVDGHDVQNLGPIDPACSVEPIAAFIDKPNPFNPKDVNPLTGAPGSLALPFRPSPELAASTPGPTWQARGLWIPNKNLARRIREGKLERSATLNFRQDELAWNHGAAQQWEQELKELYLDVEMLDNRLWLRIGRQTIVWGKTELFRSQDQFNPQDLALASLPDLEESRLALWAVRGTWSFYDAGPFDDVRLELAANFDEFQPADLGRCGEPYAVVLVCAGYFGFLAHGFEGVGIAGVELPPQWWHDSSGIEFGGRVEWRWDRFSVSLSDFYGYSDIPHIEKIFTFERNVDPETGRPRRLDDRGPCKTGSEPACLGPDQDALENHSANQTLFAKNCASTLGFLDLDRTACGPSVLNSQNPGLPPLVQPSVALALANLLSGDPTRQVFREGSDDSLDFTNTTFLALQARLDPTYLALYPVLDAQSPMVPLSRDPGDGPGLGPGFLTQTGLMRVLTDEQEALLGCGAFYQTLCDVEGVDLMNAEASALIQSWVGFEGTSGDWDTTDPGVDQPGTTGFRGGPVCTRFERGRLLVLPGCRGPDDPDYDPAVDGRLDGAVNGLALPAFVRVHPFTGQRFQSEMAVLSWNLMMTLVRNSTREGAPGETEFDPELPFRRDGCSFAKPQLCNAYSDFWRSVPVKRNVVRAGGNGRYGRRDFQWHDGTPVVTRFEKRNVLGFSMDFTEDLTKSSWGVEATWVEDVPYFDNDEFDGLTDVDTVNLTLSIDRPTFVNFLNPRRTLLFNTQWFFQYVRGFRKGFPGSGPMNTLATFTVQSGYYQDRLLPVLTLVYDFRSNSGAFLPQLTYRFTENFSATVGVALFMGRFEEKTAPLNPIASTNRTGRGAYKEFVENGLSVVRDRDEVFLRVRYSF
jgi:hypothetical protein